MISGDTDLEARLSTIPAPPAATIARPKAWLAEAATQCRLLDVAYASVNSALGRLILAATPAGIPGYLGGPRRKQALLRLESACRTRQ